MPYSTDVLTSVEIGPGKYMGLDSLGQRGSPFNLMQKEILIMGPLLRGLVTNDN